MKNISVIFYFFISTPIIFAQIKPVAAPPATVEGIVANEREELLIGATLFWKDTKTGAVTDTAGRFSLPARAQEATLVVQYVGYTPAEVQVLPGETNLWIEVKGVVELKQVTVTGHGFDSRVSMLGARDRKSVV